MKTNKFFLLFFAFVTAFGFSVQSATSEIDDVKVTIFYLSHPPAVAVLREVEKILNKYPEIKIEKFDLESSDGKDAIKKYNVRGHLPIMFFINGQSEFELEGKKILFKNFPKKDAFLPHFSGDWDYEDIEKVLKKVLKMVKS